MKKLHTNVEMHNRSRMSPIPFLNTRERDLLWTKRVAIILLVLYALVSTIILMIARSYPDSAVSKTVRALFFDVDPQIAENAVQKGNEMIDRFKAIIKTNDEIRYVKYGRHPIQDQIAKLSPMAYLGNGILSTETALTIEDYYSGDCALTEEQALLHEKDYCHETVRLTFKKAQQACEVKFDGTVADYHEYVKYILPSKRTTIKNQAHWTRQLQVEEGWFFDTHRRLILDPANSGQFLFDEEDEKHAFFCITDITSVAPVAQKQ